jgi:hypothetical protein
VVVEFGLTVSAKGDVGIAGASAAASLKVTLTYNHVPAATAPADPAAS